MRRGVVVAPKEPECVAAGGVSETRERRVSGTRGEVRFFGVSPARGERRVQRVRRDFGSVAPPGLGKKEGGCGVGVPSSTGSGREARPSPVATCGGPVGARSRSRFRSYMRRPRWGQENGTAREEHRGCRGRRDRGVTGSGVDLPTQSLANDRRAVWHPRAGVPAVPWGIHPV